MSFPEPTDHGPVAKGTHAVLQWILDSLPVWWPLALAALFFRVNANSSFEPLELIFSLWLSIGFWIAYFGAARWLFQRSAWTSVVTAPLFLLVLTMGGIQGAHHFLFGEFLHKSRFKLIRVNWDTITAEVARMAQEMPVFLAAAVLGSVLALFFSYISRSRRPVFKPLRGGGGLRALAAATWLVWWSFGFPFHGLGNIQMPVIAGHVLLNDVQLVLRKEEPGPLGLRGDPHRFSLFREKTDPVSDPPATISDRIRPNLVLILLESVRADHLPSYGYHRNTMPFTAELSARASAIQFEHAYATSTVSYFSMIALLSGLSQPESHETYARAPLIWDHLAVRGYRSFVVTQSLGYPRYMLDRYMQTPGLDSYQDIGKRQVDAFAESYTEHGIGDRLRRRLLGKFLKWLAITRDDRWSLLAVRERIAERDPSRPFFALWELECTHYTYCYPDAFRRFEPAGSFLYTRDSLASLINDYDNALFHSDHLIQRLFTFLEEEGLSDNTILMITSDHGEAFFEHGSLFHGGTPHVEKTRVPLIVYIPTVIHEQLHGTVLEALEENRTAPVQLVDLLPTLIDLADGGAAAVAPPLGHGSSLLRQLDSSRKIQITNNSPFSNRSHSKAKATVSRAGEYIITYTDGRPPECFGLKGGVPASESCAR